MNATINNLKLAVNNYKPARGAWNKGVAEYVGDLFEVYADRAEYEEREAVTTTEFKNWILNGARTWSEYSHGGSSLIYDYDIAERLCNNTELKITDNGRKAPNKRESWLDVQARALYQAAQILTGLFEDVREYDDNGEPLPRF